MIGFQTPVRMTGVDVTNHGVFGIECFKTCNLYGPATVSGNGTGIQAATVVKIRALTVRPATTIGIVAVNVERGRALVYDTSVITGNWIGVYADRFVKSVNSSDHRQHRDRHPGRPGRRLSAQGAGHYQVGHGHRQLDRRRLWHDRRLRPISPPVPTAPHVAGGATCDHSYVIGSGIPGSDWDVCALD